MTLAEKLLRAKTDIDEVYEAGYNKGVEAQPTPTIEVSTEGLITSTAGEKSATKQLTTQAAKTITPSTLNQTAIGAGTYATGAVTVAGDGRLIPANIVKGKTIFNVTGNAPTYQEGYNASQIRNFPLIMQGLAIPTSSQETDGEYAYKKDDYNDNAGNFGGYSFEDLIDITLYGTSEELELECFNDTDFKVSVWIDSGSISGVGDYLLHTAIIPPHEPWFFYNTSTVQSEDDWTYSIIGVRFMLDE